MSFSPRSTLFLLTLSVTALLTACGSEASDGGGPAATDRAAEDAVTGADAVTGPADGADDGGGDVPTPEYDCESLFALTAARAAGQTSCSLPLGGAGVEGCPGDLTANQCARTTFRDAETAAHTELSGATGSANFSGAYLPPCDDLETPYDLELECGEAAPVRCTDGTRPIIYVDLADAASTDWLFYLGGEGKSCVGTDDPEVAQFSCSRMYLMEDNGHGTAYDLTDSRALSSYRLGGANPFATRGSDSDQSILGESEANRFRQLNRVWFERCNAYDGDVDQVLDVDGLPVRVFQHGERITRLAFDALLAQYPDRFDESSDLLLAGTSDGSSALPFSGHRLATHFDDRIGGAGASSVRMVIDGLWFPMMAGEAAFNANQTDAGGYDGFVADSDSFLDGYRDNPIGASVPGRTEVYADTAFETGAARKHYEGQGWSPPAFCTSGCFDRDHLMTRWLLDDASAVDGVFLSVDLNDASISIMSGGGTGQTVWTEVPTSEPPWGPRAFEARLRKQALDLRGDVLASGDAFGLWGQAFWGHTTLGSGSFAARELFACDADGQVQQALTLEQAMWAWATGESTAPLVVDGAPVVEAPALTWRDQNDCTDAKDAACAGLPTGTPCGEIDVPCAPAPAGALLVCTSEAEGDPVLACLGVEPGGACGEGTCEANADEAWLCPTSLTPYQSCNGPAFDPETDPCAVALSKVCSPTGRCSPPCLPWIPKLGDAVCDAFGDSPGGQCKACPDCLGEGPPGLCR